MSYLLAVVVAMASLQDGSLTPEAWVHAGDTDGDGLQDGFELARGLDPDKVDTFGDGTPDESRTDGSGKAMWEVQESENALPAGDGGVGGGGACGALGMEALAAVSLLWAFRRPRNPSR